MIRILAILLLLASVALAQGPEPAPWWQRVEEWQSLFLKWFIALTAILGGLFGVVMYVLQKLREVRRYVNDKTEDTEKRLDRQTNAIQATQEQVVDLAKVVPPQPTVVMAQQNAEDPKK